MLVSAATTPAGPEVLPGIQSYSSSAPLKSVVVLYPLLQVPGNRLVGIDGISGSEASSRPGALFRSQAGVSPGSPLKSTPAGSSYPVPREWPHIYTGLSPLLALIQSKTWSASYVMPRSDGVPTESPQPAREEQQVGEGSQRQIMKPGE